MDNNIVSEKRHLVSVAAGPIAIAQADGQINAMRIEKVERASLFMISHTLVWPRAVFEMFICLSQEEAPLRAVCSTTYVERTWNGFGIGAEISTMSQRDQDRWESYVRKATRSESAGYSTGLSALSTAQSASIIVVSMALSDRLVSSLQQRGLSVQRAETTADALEYIEAPGSHTVVADQHGDMYDGTELCRRLSQADEPVRSVLLTSQKKPHVMELSLYAGATMVVARPCSQDLLLQRLLDLVGHRLSESEAEQPQSAMSPTVSRSLLARLSGWAAAHLNGTWSMLLPSSLPVASRGRSAC